MITFERCRKFKRSKGIFTFFSCFYHDFFAQKVKFLALRRLNFNDFSKVARNSTINSPFWRFLCFSKNTIPGCGSRFPARSRYSTDSRRNSVESRGWLKLVRTSILVSESDILLSSFQNLEGDCQNFLRLRFPGMERMFPTWRRHDRYLPIVKSGPAGNISQTQCWGLVGTPEARRISFFQKWPFLDPPGYGNEKRVLLGLKNTPKSLKSPDAARCRPKMMENSTFWPGLDRALIGPGQKVTKHTQFWPSSARPGQNRTKMVLKWGQSWPNFDRDPTTMVNFMKTP